MLRRVRVPARRFADYRPFVDSSIRREVQDLAAGLRGRRILHINSTSLGGGVAELLRSEVALLRGLGVDVEWRVIEARPKFFRITKQIHNGLQGGPILLDREEKRHYEAESVRFARKFSPREYDLIVVHDPQPAGILTHGRSGNATWIWRCHIDLSQPNPDYAAWILPYLEPYHEAVYSRLEYALAGARPPARAVEPAIDPLSAKNREMHRREAERRVAAYGIDPNKPLVTQVSRFDPWKDPAGAVEAWKIARKSVLGLQLALVGNFADDDPEGEAVLTQIKALIDEMEDVFVVANQASDRDVHAFQSVSTAVLQCSTREGFGLSVAEAQWAGTPVVARPVGGIPLQVVDGRTGYLVETIEEMAERVVRLVQRPALRDRLGRAGRERIRRRFLMPRLVRDDLRLWKRLLPRHRVARRAGRVRSMRRRSRPRRVLVGSVRE